MLASSATALMGVNADRVVQITSAIGGLMAGRAAVLYMVKIGVVKIGVTRSDVASSSASRRSPQPSSEASATCGERWWAA